MDQLRAHAKQIHRDFEPEASEPEDSFGWVQAAMLAEAPAAVQRSARRAAAVSATDLLWNMAEIPPGW